MSGKHVRTKAKRSRRARAKRAKVTRIGRRRAPHWRLTVIGWRFDSTLKSTLIHTKKGKKK